MRLDRIRLADIRPDENNPRTEFGDIDALAASFAWTPGRPGEPVNPLYVVQDGNVYRILDGERRYRAMSAAGKVESCECLVAENADDRETMLVMIATDDKRPLSSSEKDKGVQQALLLNVDEDAIADVSKVDRGRLRKARKAVSSIGHVTQLSLQSLAEIGELEDPEDVKAVEDALAADPSSEWGSPWRVELRDRIGAQRARARRAEIEQALSDAGIPVATSDPKDSGLVVHGRASSAERALEFIAELNEITERRDCRCAVWLPPLERDRWGTWNADAWFYVEPAEDPEEAAREAERLEAKRWRELLDEFRDARFTYLADLAGNARVDLSRMPGDAAKAVTAKLWAGACRGFDLDAFQSTIGVELVPSCGPLVVAMAWAAGVYETEFGGYFVTDLAKGAKLAERQADMMREWINDLEQLEQVGYIAAAEEIELRGKFVDALATYGAPAGGNEPEEA